MVAHGDILATFPINRRPSGPLEETMSIASTLIALACRRAAARFEKATRDPLGAQKEQLFSILRGNAATEYGRRYGFGAIASIADYRRRVPVISYRDIEEEVKRVLSGAKNVLTAEDPVMFSRSSGTTGEPKYIPVTRSCQGRAHKDVMRTWMFHAQKAHPDLFAGKVVSLVSPAVEGHAPCGVPFGSTSGQMYRDMPRLVRSAYAIPYEVFEIEDYAAKYYVIMRIAAVADVRFLATANPSSILRLCEKASEFGEELIRDVRDGTLARDLAVESSLRRHLEPLFRPDPEGARRLEAARAKRGGMLKPVDYWPHLHLIGCWKGGTVGRYLESFQQWFDPDARQPVPVRDWGYLSSEARGSVPLSDEGSQGVLTVGSNFFEFVAAGEMESKGDDLAACNFLTVEGLEKGKEYYIFLTTTGGLYRYDINDIVRVTGFYNAAPQIEFLRKGRGMTNLTGEKVDVNQVMAAVDAAGRAVGTVPAHFLAEADDEQNRYLLRVEFGASVSAEAGREFLREFDRQLKSINIEYKGKRESLRLGAPVLHVMRQGWYERVHRQQVDSGMRDFQVKAQILIPIAEEPQQVAPDIEEVVELEES